MEDKLCIKCKQVFPLTNFSTLGIRNNKVRYRSICKPCAVIHNQEYCKKEPFKVKCSRAKTQALKKNVPFDLTPEYLESIWSSKCAISGVPILLYEGKYSEECAELDRLIPSKGYVKGNVAFISRRMNRIKNDGTPEELIQIGEWLKKELEGGR